MAVTTAFTIYPVQFSLSRPKLKAHKPQNCCPSTKVLGKNSNSRSISDFRPLRLIFTDRTGVAPKRVNRVWADSGLAGGSSETYPELGPLDSNPGATIDLKLPRRRLLVEFTCNACGERTKRLINRLAYERGTVFIQCAGCQQHHKLVDNLNLVVEYDLREDVSMDKETDQV